MKVPMNTQVQDNFLMEAKKQETPMVIYMMNGFQMRGKIIGDDDFTIVFESDGRQQLLYKHAISTVAPTIPMEGSQNYTWKSNR